MPHEAALCMIRGSPSARSSDCCRRGSCRSQQQRSNQSTRKRGHVRFAAISLRLQQPFGHQQMLAVSATANNSNCQQAEQVQVSVSATIRVETSRLECLCFEIDVFGRSAASANNPKSKIKRCVRGCVWLSVCVCVCATTPSKRNRRSTCELLILLLPLRVCVCVACVINFWHLNWTPSTSQVLNQFDKFAFFGLQETKSKTTKMPKPHQVAKCERGSAKRRPEKNQFHLQITNWWGSRRVGSPFPLTQLSSRINGRVTEGCGKGGVRGKKSVSGFTGAYSGIIDWNDFRVCLCKQS